MNKDILVPLDGSQLSERALSLATAIASRSGGALHLVHVHTPHRPIYVEGLPVLDEEGRPTHLQHSQAYLESLEARLTAESNLEIDIAILQGDPAAALAAYASAQQIGLAIMTTHGHGGLTRAWLGSVADTLIRNSPAPLLLLRASEEIARSTAQWDAERILVLLDGSALAEQILNPVEYLSKLMGSHCILLSVTQPPLPLSERVLPFGRYIPALPTDTMEQVAQQYLQQIASRLEEQGITTTTKVVLSDQVAQRILESATALDASLIAMTTRGNSGLRRLLVGSVADKVLRGAEIPLLLCTPNMPGSDEG